MSKQQSQKNKKQTLSTSKLDSRRDQGPNKVNLKPLSSVQLSSRRLDRNMSASAVLLSQNKQSSEDDFEFNRRSLNHRMMKQRELSHQMKNTDRDEQIRAV